MLELNKVSKTFFGNIALREVSFTAYPGEIHALMGQNGAGKSTLMKILSGAYSLDSGEIRINGQVVRINAPKDAEKYGISIVYQELSTLPHLTVAQNIVIGHEPLTRIGFLDERRSKAVAEQALKSLGIAIDVNSKMGELNVSQQQICEIAKCISKKPRIVILDEPTASLTKFERDTLFQVMRKMRDDGLAVIFISHHLEDVFELADRCTVLRDGRTVFTGEIRDIDEYKLVQLMVGHTMSDFYPSRSSSPSDTVALELQGLGGGMVNPVNLKLRYGEVVGLSGLIGSGRTELARMIFGIDRPSSGRILVDGEEVNLTHPYQAIRNGISLITEDRRIDGLALNLPVRFNISFPVIVSGKRDICKRSWVRINVERTMVETLVKRIKIKCSSMEDRVVSLSGGNQQKTSIAKWLATQSRIYIFDEPTKGIDVAAKVEVYKIINELAEQGAAVLVISSYNPELIGICDRILVMSRGSIVREFSSRPSEADLVLAQSM
ncbi:MAG: sugar ABC transporter ATP-binding protein [Alicyclobacillus sp.]|nr:sugar ABC transporter ATP-binding protein [Alicyclobacillus sp.]